MRYVIVLGWLLLSLGATASPIESLARLLEPYRTFSADFQQSTFDSKGASITKMTGALAIASDSIFYWKTNPPFSQVIVADGEVLWVFDEDLYQVQVRPLDDTMTASPAAILSGDLDVLGSRFQVTEERTGTIAVYALEPRATDESDPANRIAIRWGPITGFIDRGCAWSSIACLTDGSKIRQAGQYAVQIQTARRR